jgi:hypothetical protein
MLDLRYIQKLQVYFSTIKCLRYNVTPLYARIKLNCNSIAARKTKE